jgi:hypothetical protein
MENESNRQKLKTLLVEKRLQRLNKLGKENTLDKVLKSMSINKDELKKDLENIKKQGGLNISLNK